MTFLIDTHVNLHGEQYDDDREEVLLRARESGIGGFISICDRLENFDKIHALTMANDDIWCSVGVHPHYAKDFPDLSAGHLVDLAQRSRVCGIGETGLDLHYGYSPLEDQVACFRQHVLAAQETGLPLIIHTREADTQMGDIMEEMMAQAPFRPLMHCYTSGIELARRAIALDAYFSISGIVTFKKAEDVREVVRIMPDDRIILETDCPYLAPMPHRGRRNEPAYLNDICDYVANMKGMSREELAALTTQNARTLFKTVSI
ncbi:MAG: LuxR family transcriptional regulator [Hirschia sp.]|nr:LuxR family transcriptional regulator [Hirschia sp.]MBB36833.1 LuxR family transcriptional regulator [Hirschia sp.]MBF17919.1 LuxR family transcriptional regulator [Hirschia sp.]|tara:strand:+ start:682 stop:1464 length:783 start_codon:yes stop_codon:yes gene_type:complete